MRWCHRDRCRARPAHTPLTGEGHGPVRLLPARRPTVATTSRGANGESDPPSQGTHVSEEVHMALMAVAFPIVPGKTEAWREFAATINGSRRDDFVASRERVGIRERTFFQSTPMGDLVIVTIEGDDPMAAFGQLLSQNDDELSQWFLAHASSTASISPRRSRHRRPSWSSTAARPSRPAAASPTFPEAPRSLGPPRCVPPRSLSTAPGRLPRATASRRRSRRCSTPSLLASTSAQPRSSSGTRRPRP